MTITIKNLLFILGLMISLESLSQEVRQPKKIITSLNDTVIYIKEYDEKDSLIFFKDIQIWKDNSEHIFIDGYIFQDNRVIYDYHATEDFLRLIRYEYDSLTGLREKFIKHTDNELINNELLHDIQNRNDLINLVESVISKDRDLINISKPNEIQTLIKKGRSTIYTRSIDSVVVYELLETFDKRGNLVLVKEKNEWQTTVTKFKYNRMNQLKKEFFGFDDYQSKTTYFYDNGQLTKSINKQKNGLVSTCDYIYENGMLIKKIVDRPEGIRIYTYEYEF